MTKVNNRKAVSRLAFREIKANRRMNFTVILSVVLTCILFTALTSIGGSLINGAQQEIMRQIPGNRMAGVKYVLPEDYEKVKADKAVRDAVYHIIVGTVINDELENIYAEIDCAGDENAAKASFCCPTTGRLPESYDEIAMSTLVLDKLGLSHETGTSVPIMLDIDGNISEHIFTLCGFWQGDEAAMAQLCWVSREFADKNAPTPAESYYSHEFSGFAGYWQVDFNYADSWDIEGKTEKLISRIYGGSDIAPETGINWAYMANTVDGGMLACGIVMIIVIFAAGYLIIYNIFHINISANIRSYGLLKTIGTTSKQIRHMVKIQAAVYCAVGIPFGLAAGILLSRIMMDSVMNMIDIRSAASYAVNAELIAVICIISAVFTFATVMISCRKPCIIAGSVSPIEALRYNETDIRTNSAVKKTAVITPFSIARSNMSRNGKKTIIVVISLSLGMILVNSLFTVLKGVDADKFISHSIVGDILIRHTDRTDLWDERVKGITPEMIAEFERIDGAEVHPVYYERGNISPDGEPLERMKKLAEKYTDNETRAASLDSAVSGSHTAEIYGIDEAAAAYLEPDEGVVDVDKLKSGRYAVVHTYLWQADDDKEVEVYHAGDKLTVSCGDKKREYEVMAVCSMTFPLSTKVYNMFQTEVIISAEEYMYLTDDPGAASIMITTDDESGFVKKMCRAYCESEDSPLVYSDKQTYLDSFDDFIGMIKLVGGALTGILALIGILNFINASVTGIISRKREFAVMNAVGMTGRQLKRMLMWEGIHYALLTTCCSIVFGSLLSYFVIKKAEYELFFFTYRFTVMPVIICMPFFIVLAAIVPTVSYKVICRNSIVNRIREN